MKKVLLAIDGISPDKMVFDYAVQLCKGIKAGLNVLQIVSAASYSGYFRKVREQAGRVKRHFEGSMVAATFAEAGEHEVAKEMMDEALRNINLLLPESEKAGIQCHLTLKLGSPTKEIVNYVKKCRDVVLAIYDAPRADKIRPRLGREARGILSELQSELSIPLVTIRSKSELKSI